MSILQTFQQKGILPEHYYNLTIQEMEQRISRIKQKWGERLFIPGHHYQKEEVIQFADVSGDSLQLAQICAENTEAEYIVFCGVHFMAETADMLTSKNQKVILPDMKAGCSMADMADIYQTERAFQKLTERYGNTIIPLTYVNSTAAIKAFCGKHGGATVTSSNAEQMVKWAMKQKKRILFLPDQHLGRNTAFRLGISLDEMAVWNPETEALEQSSGQHDVRVILWKGHCSVHEKFTVENINEFRQNKSDYQIIVHPECSHEVVQASDLNGSTHFIIETIKHAEQGTKWAVGTEMNLVQRLSKIFPHVTVESLNPYMCPCLTMNRIDLPHLLWTLETMEEPTFPNFIKVDDRIKTDALKALKTMLEHV